MNQFKRMKDKFLGSILGSVVGDSWGARYEGSYHGSVRVEDFDLVGGRYTDDSEMMKGVLESICANKGKFNGPDLAKTFVQNFDHTRGYGPSTISVLMKIKDGDPWDKPAKEAFYGEGSLGNGAAMRICPIGLLYHNDQKKLIEVTDQISMITHTHRLGRQGAILQACAVALAVESDPRNFEPHDFVEKLKNLPHELSPVYQKKLVKIETYLNSPPPTDRIVKELGVNVTAPDSVPIAIYNFLINSSNFYEVLHSSISCGGDTDTIACMSGAIAGAFLGIREIPKNWIDIVEDLDVFQGLAVDLYELWVEKASK
ncbi:MAG: ADP-ribosylglycohydrolase family protein [Candidatus Hodarchaeota archaeon]